MNSNNYLPQIQFYNGLMKEERKKGKSIATWLQIHFSSLMKLKIWKKFDYSINSELQHHLLKRSQHLGREDQFQNSTTKKLPVSKMSKNFLNFFAQQIHDERDAPRQNDPSWEAHDKDMAREDSGLKSHEGTDNQKHCKTGDTQRWVFLLLSFTRFSSHIGQMTTVWRSVRRIGSW